MDNRGPFFREIHKNTWLKRLYSEGRKFQPVGKRSEKNWVVFCVHNDTEALLEGYAEPRSAASHNPDWIISLQNAQHISHSLVPNEHEYEFVITLNDEVVKFHALSWEVMQEWVATLRSKLRELKVLSPRENLYTKLPEPRLPLLPTRDPTSPLPATPEVPPVIVPGVERVVPPSSTVARDVNPSQHIIHPAAEVAEETENQEQRGESISVQNVEENSPSTSCSTRASIRLGRTSPMKKVDVKSSSVNENSVKVDIVLDNSSQPSTSAQIISNSYRPDESLNLGRRNSSKEEATSTVQNTVSKTLGNTQDEVVTNITIIQVSNTFPINETKAECDKNEEFKSNIEILPSNDEFVREVGSSNKMLISDAAANLKTKEISNEITTVHVSGFPQASAYGFVYPPEDISEVASSSRSENVILSANATGVTNISIGNEDSERINNRNKFRQNPKFRYPTDNPSKNVSSLDLQLSKVSISEGFQNPASPRVRTTSEVCASANNIFDVPSTSTSNVRKVKNGQVNDSPGFKERPPLLRGKSEAMILTRSSRIDHRKPRTDVHNLNLHPQLDKQSESPFHRSRLTTSVSATRNDENKRREPARKTASLNVQPNKTLTFREQQVLFLKKEIMHPGGIRLQLRRKDCFGSIAWVDAFDRVWVAGWKQKDHPMLYNALHIGDQLISIAQKPVINADEANKIIRNSNTLFLEILVRRVPFGRVYAIRREKEGQCLGLIRDGNTPTIVDVVPNSLAARHGLPPRVKSCDGLHLTFWVLTEINGRPLNLFSKENEVQDRLNCVGRDISILVQPSDLIMKLKKQLKSLRSYKDYIVQ